MQSECDQTNNPINDYDDDPSEQDSQEVIEPWHEWAQRTTKQAEQHLQRLNIETWVHTIRRSKWRYLKQVMEMPDDKWTKITFNWSPSSTNNSVRRNEGHPRTRWLDDIDKHLKHNNIESINHMTPNDQQLLEIGYVNRA